MLKIRDNVDLKELEKYRMKYVPYSEVGEDEYVDFPVVCGLLYDFYFDKTKYMKDTYGIIAECEDLEIFYDLVKDGIIEKVESD